MFLKWKVNGSRVWVEEEGVFYIEEGDEVVMEEEDVDFLINFRWSVINVIRKDIIN